MANKPRCVPGDMALVINDLEEPINNGQLVRVNRAATPDEFTILEIEWECTALSTIRMGELVYSPGEDGIGYRDRELWPIRPGNGLDETLQRTGLPAHPVPA